MPKDLFSSHAQAYAANRPVYPMELYKFILQHVSETKIAWDCATGNGQAAYALAQFFTQVEATDLSARQIGEAVPLPNIRYSVAPAEETFFADSTFDLVTVAQAYHWFDYEKFNVEVRRVIKPNGIIAIWGYGLIKSENKDITAIIKRFYEDEIGEYWDPERKHVEDLYRSLPFPYERIEAPEFQIEMDYTLEQLLSYLETWSAVQKYIHANQRNPVIELKTLLASYWNKTGRVRFEFPLFLLLGKVL